MAEQNSAQQGADTEPTGTREKRSAVRYPTPVSDVSGPAQEAPAARLPGELESGMRSGVDDEADISPPGPDGSDLTAEEARRVLTAPTPEEEQSEDRQLPLEKGHDTESD